MTICCYTLKEYPGAKLSEVNHEWASVGTGCRASLQEAENLLSALGQKPTQPNPWQSAREFLLCTYTL